MRNRESERRALAETGYRESTWEQAGAKRPNARTVVTAAAWRVWVRASPCELRWRRGFSCTYYDDKSAKLQMLRMHPVRVPSSWRSRAQDYMMVMDAMKMS